MKKSTLEKREIVGKFKKEEYKMGRLTYENIRVSNKHDIEENWNKLFHNCNALMIYGTKVYNLV